MVDIVTALMNPKSYDEPTKKIRLMQTHISWIFLTGRYAYKVKKPVNFGFCNFSTLAKRKFFCYKELKINRQFSDMYLEVVPINQFNNDIKIKGKGKTIEYAVKMRELPQERMMCKLLEKNRVRKQTIEEIAKIVSEFHLKLKQNRRTKKYGSPRIIRYNFDENFNLVKKFIGITIDRKKFDFIKGKVYDFLEHNKKLFKERIIDGKIKDCHGDLHSENIFLSDKIYIFDAIEFNDRLKCGDVAKDVAFFLMDLDFHKKHGLVEIFLKKYLAHTKDKEMLRLLPLYKCYYAYVRGKINSLKSADERVSVEEKQESIKLAKKYFDLAFNYAKRL
ncbi:MAG: hypothetical protein QMD14_00510 [Candidatus Aenigmarchaeota archaeon]|nr:hypothetical protein [Candidatus Aenigmarchaeota archaeon]